jgi:hypothetical protein
MYALSAKTKVCPNRTNQDAKYLAECNCYVPEVLGGVFHSEGLGCLGERCLVTINGERIRFAHSLLWNIRDEMDE